MNTTPNSREQYSAHLPALHLLCNLGWNFLTTAQALALRGSTREVLLKLRLIEWDAAGPEDGETFAVAVDPT